MKFRLNLFIKAFQLRLRATALGAYHLISGIFSIFIDFSGVFSVLDKQLDVRVQDLARLIIAPEVGCSLSLTLHYGEPGASQSLTREIAGW